jgi:hypothetical protein
MGVLGGAWGSYLPFLSLFGYKEFSIKRKILTFYELELLVQNNLKYNQYIVEYYNTYFIRFKTNLQLIFSILIY